MGILGLFFGFKGRIKRGQYWAAAGVQFVVLVMMVIGLIGSLGLSAAELSAQRAAMNEEVLAKVGTVGIGLIIGLIINMWSVAAIYTKRLHDRNKGAIWLLAIYGPAFGSIVFPPLLVVSLISCIWVFIELGCLPGTDGPNRFDDGAPQGQDFKSKTKVDVNSAPRNLGGMEGALAAINAAARERASASPAPTGSYRAPTSSVSFGQEAPAQFGRRTPPNRGSFNNPQTSGGFGRKI